MLASLLIVLAADPVAVAAAPPAAREAEALETGRRVQRMALAGDPALAQMVSPEFRSQIGGAVGLEGMSRSIADQLGAEGAVESESVATLHGVTIYRRLSRFERAGLILNEWTWDGADVVLGGRIAPAPPAAATEHEGRPTVAALRLPFAAPPQGAWTTVWGGHDVARNYHVVAPDQRFAYDFLVVKDGASYAGDRLRLESYHCWGLPVLAPGSGRVTAAVDGIHDSAVQTTNVTDPAGNHVVIDHGAGEHSLIAHLRNGSVSVRVGYEVTTGQPVGVCGNSGASSEPHVHYHLQTGAAFGQGVGLPAQFHGYLAEGEAVARGEPQRGQVIIPGGPQ